MGEDYNGWTNRATWLVNLWVMNDYDTYMLYRFSPFIDEYDVEYFVRNKISQEMRASILRDMETDDFDDVDWSELLEAWNEE